MNYFYCVCVCVWVCACVCVSSVWFESVPHHSEKIYIIILQLEMETAYLFFLS